jgi:hypothetical protein
MWLLSSSKSEESRKKKKKRKETKSVICGFDLSLGMDKQTIEKPIKEGGEIARHATKENLDSN